MRIVVAMSGGVDSSAAAALLQEQGHEVLGITLRVWSDEGAAKCGRCCGPDDIEDARAVARALGIAHYVASAEELFRERVVKPFVQSYLSGRTPVPCVACNEEVKFRFLLDRARALGARLATGHYARISSEGGRHRLFRAKDARKDQSYFLFTLGQGELRDLCFPVGEMSKPEVRALAFRHRLPTSHKPESMEICFVPDGDYAAFVERMAGPQPPGEIVAAEGNVLGTHAGVHRFTVGQRRGLGLGRESARYVQLIDPKRRRVVVGPAGEAQRASFEVQGLHWVDEPPRPEAPVTIRIRHRHAGARGKISLLGEGRARVELDSPARAVTPGQAAVVYDGEQVLGGGWIA